MESPVDVLIERLSKLADNGTFGSEFDYTALARDLGEQLAERFAFIGDDEINAVAIDVDEGRGYQLEAGTGPETIRGNPDDNPMWLYNSAVNALAMFRHLNRLEQQRRRLKRRPAPGLYDVVQANGNHFHMLVTADQQMLGLHPGGLRLAVHEAWDAVVERQGPGEAWTLIQLDASTGDAVQR